SLSGFTVADGGSLTLRGYSPVIFEVRGDALIAGTLSAGADILTPGAGGRVCANTVPRGAGIDGVADVATGGGGGGAFGAGGGGGGSGGAVVIEAKRLVLLGAVISANGGAGGGGRSDALVPGSPGGDGENGRLDSAQPARGGVQGITNAGLFPGDGGPGGNG